MTANPSQGWRVSPSPGAQLKRTAAGRYAMPMEITYNGDHISSIDHVYTGGEIEQLYRQMRDLFAEGTAPAPVAEAPPIYSAAAAAAADRRGQTAEMGQWQ